MTINIFHVVSNKYWGGPEEYAYEMVSKLRNDQRYYAEVVCKKNEPVLLHFRRLEIPISILPLKGMTDIDSPTRLARLLRKGHNIVHVHTFKDAFTAVMARRISENRNTRVIMTIHGICRPKTNYIYRKLYQSIDKMVFVSHRAYDEWMNHAKGFNHDKACIIRDSVIDNPLASPAPDIRRKFNIPGDKTLIMFHGRLTPEKGVDILLKTKDHDTAQELHCREPATAKCLPGRIPRRHGTHHPTVRHGRTAIGRTRGTRHCQSRVYDAGKTTHHNQQRSTSRVCRRPTKCHTRTTQRTASPCTGHHGATRQP